MEGGVPFHRFCNGLGRGGEGGINAAQIVHGQVFGHVGDPVLHIFAVEGGEREDIP